MAKTNKSPKEISLTEFAEKYLSIKTEKGDRLALPEAQLNMLRAIEKAEKNGYEMRFMKGRGGNRVVFVKTK